MPLDKNNNQDVPLKAVVFNLLGMVSFDLKDSQEAKKAFGESLKIMPEFNVAKENITFLEKGTTTTPVKVPTNDKK